MFSNKKIKNNFPVERKKICESVLKLHVANRKGVLNSSGSFEQNYFAIKFNILLKKNYNISSRQI